MFEMISKLFLVTLIPLLVLTPTLSYAVLPMDDPFKRHHCIQAGIMIAVHNSFGKTTEQDIIDSAGNLTETCLTGVEK